MGSPEVLNRVGILIAGNLGNTGSTLAGTLLLMEQGIITAQEIPSSLAAFLRLRCPHPKVSLGGWDFQHDSLLSVLSNKKLIPNRLLSQLVDSSSEHLQFGAVSTTLDFHTLTAQDRLGVNTFVSDGVELVKADIAEFKSKFGCEHVIVIYLGSPARPSVPSLSVETCWQDLLDRTSCTVPGNLIYAMASIESGADIIDFTPSEGLTSPALIARGVSNGVQIVGRDGSTGQTMLKAAVAEMLVLRGLRLRSWFSSNHLGNHDGLVLSSEEFSWLKIQDKKRGLSELMPEDNYEHVVSIDYVESKGDQKEAFDSVRAEDIFGGALTLRLNWEGWDSALAVPMLVDLIDLVVLGRNLGLSGLQPQLGFFFKAPLGGRAESPSRAHKRLTDFYSEQLNRVQP